MQEKRPKRSQLVPYEVLVGKLRQNKSFNPRGDRILTESFENLSSFFQDSREQFSDSPSRNENSTMRKFETADPKHPLIIKIPTIDALRASVGSQDTSQQSTEKPPRIGNSRIARSGSCQKKRRDKKKRESNISKRKESRTNETTPTMENEVIETESRKPDNNHKTEENLETEELDVQEEYHKTSPPRRVPSLSKSTERELLLSHQPRRQLVGLIHSRTIQRDDRKKLSLPSTRQKSLSEKSGTKSQVESEKVIVYRDVNLNSMQNLRDQPTSVNLTAETSAESSKRRAQSAMKPKSPTSRKASGQGSQKHDMAEGNSYDDDYKEWSHANFLHSVHKKGSKSLSGQALKVDPLEGPGLSVDGYAASNLPIHDTLTSPPSDSLFSFKNSIKEESRGETDRTKSSRRRPMSSQREYPSKYAGGSPGGGELSSREKGPQVAMNKIVINCLVPSYQAEEENYSLRRQKTWMSGSRAGGSTSNRADLRTTSGSPASRPYKKSRTPSPKTKSRGKPGSSTGMTKEKTTRSPLQNRKEKKALVHGPGVGILTKTKISLVSEPLQKSSNDGKHQTPFSQRSFKYVVSRFRETLETMNQNIRHRTLNDNSFTEEGSEGARDHSFFTPRKLKHAGTATIDVQDFPSTQELNRKDMRTLSPNSGPILPRDDVRQTSPGGDYQLRYKTIAKSLEREASRSRGVTNSAPKRSSPLVNRRDSSSGSSQQGRSFQGNTMVSRKAVQKMNEINHGLGSIKLKTNPSNSRSHGSGNLPLATTGMIATDMATDFQHRRGGEENMTLPSMSAFLANKAKTNINHYYKVPYNSATLAGAGKAASSGALGRQARGATGMKAKPVRNTVSNPRLARGHDFVRTPERTRTFATPADVRGRHGILPPTAKLIRNLRVDGASPPP